MHPLLITDKSLPSQGGSQVIFHHVYQGLRPHPVTMLSRQYRAASTFDASAGYSIHRVPFVNIPKVRMPLLWMSLAAAAPALLYRCGADQVHCGQSIETGWIGRWCKRRFGVPYVVHTFLEEIMVYRRGRVTGPMLQAVLRDADAVTTISQYSRERLIQLGVEARRIYLLYPGVTPSGSTGAEGAAIRKRWGLEKKKVVLTVGRLAPRKGHDRVIRALPRVAAAIPEAIYLIVGGGPERQNLQSLVHRLGMTDRVIFAGPVAHRDTDAYYRAADLFVMANRELENGDVEGFGLVFLEANAAGLPVIGGRSGGTADAILHGETGWLIDSDDEPALAERIIQLLRDSNLARRFGEAGRERVTREFTWERAAAVVERIGMELSGQAPAMRSGFAA